MIYIKAVCRIWQAMKRRAKNRPPRGQTDPSFSITRIRAAPLRVSDMLASHPGVEDIAGV